MSDEGSPRVALDPAGLPAAVHTISRELAAGGFRAWLVGGSVRDSLLGQLDGSLASGAWVSKDWDIATDAQPKDVIRLFRRVVPTGIEHGTVTVLIGRASFEVTTLRAETTYSDGRRPDHIDFVGSIEQDLARRDFTVNAIAVDPSTGSLIDPFGGVPDLERRCLRAVGEPERRFAEDGLRVLRAARFVASLGFELEPATAHAIAPSLDTFRKVSPERVRDEWTKTLLAPTPSRGFEVMREHGLLAITAPELARLAEAPSPDADNALRHTLSRVDRAPRELELRLAALYADLPRARAGDTRLAFELMTRLRFSNAERKRVVDLLTPYPIVYSRSWTDVDLRRWLRRVGPDVYADLCRLERANLAVHQPPRESELAALTELEERAKAALAQDPPLSLGQLAINGRTLMTSLGVKPGPALGETLEKLLELVVDDPSLNREETLLERARQMLVPLTPPASTRG
jgi:tRNA nucleotidyltransferase (CCA-adding enzyme)